MIDLAQQRWTPEQATAVARFLDQLSDAIWRAFGAAIVRAHDRDACDLRQLDLPFHSLHDEIPF